MRKVHVPLEKSSTTMGKYLAVFYGLNIYGPQMSMCIKSNMELVEVLLIGKTDLVYFSRGQIEQ